ncbi:hypothetical protein A3L12_04710 [Thermococcus sp. P6]|uniref:hypothetical protein n=1 Tax=Thermococcus sp. P6 TaxID=122420 RepID=UPI000B59BFAE|nr:hypothetical protein [Thermococcus sp. P6]ASJ10648.1 hypothetical protein A3L12_04710 [Thermococcus sp. P6]
MRRLMTALMVFLLLTPLSRVAAGAVDNPQPLFEVGITLTVNQVRIGNSTTWLGTFKIHAHLKDPGMRAYFEYLAANNSTYARERFSNFVEQLIYENLKDDIERGFEGVNVSSTIYLPPEGPVRVLDNWSALVTFSVTNFLVGDWRVLRCPLSGPLDFVYRGHVFDYSWDRFTLILPRDYEIETLAPVPDELSDNVAVWNGGDFIPLIELYTPLYSYVEFLNSTRKEISLLYDPEEGYVQFNATFSGANATSVVVNQLLASFKDTMQIMSIDALQRNGSLVVVGIARPEVAYAETSSERVWRAMVKLPGSFDSISVVGGSYTIAPDHTVVITVREKKSRGRIYLYGAGAGLVGVAVFLLWRRRGRTPGEEGEASQGAEPENPSEEPEGGGE